MWYFLISRNGKGTFEWEVRLCVSYNIQIHSRISVFCRAVCWKTSRQVLKDCSPRGQRGHLGLATSCSGLMALPPMWHISKHGGDGSWIRWFDHHWMADAGTPVLQNLSPYHQGGGKKSFWVKEHSEDHAQRWGEHPPSHCSPQIPTVGILGAASSHRWGGRAA